MHHVFLVLHLDSKSATDCTTGFLSIMDLQQAAPNGDSHQSVYWILITKHQNQQWIIPDMTFNCRGYIRKWTVGLHEQTGVHDSYPEIQTSRLCDGTSNVYARQQTTHFRNASCENGIASVSTNVYSCTLPSPRMAVEPGDILGIYQPRR